MVRKYLLTCGAWIVVLVWLAASGGMARGAEFIRSDVNQDGTSDISDAMSVLVFLFIDGDAVPGCFDSADVNDSGELDLSDAIHLLGYLFLGGPAPPEPFSACGEDPTDDDLPCYSFSNGDCPPLGPPSGSLLGASDCKSHEGAGVAPATTAEECVEYDFNDSNTLVLHHLNASLNCCPEGIVVEVTVEDGTISIMEGETYEDHGPCSCLCLYDLHMEVTNLRPGDYTIKVGWLLSFSASLVHGAAGRHCEPRDQYPWGM